MSCSIARLNTPKVQKKSAWRWRLQRHSTPQARHSVSVRHWRPCWRPVRLKSGLQTSGLQRAHSLRTGADWGWPKIWRRWAGLGLSSTKSCSSVELPMAAAAAGRQLGAVLGCSTPLHSQPCGHRSSCNKRLHACLWIGWGLSGGGLLCKDSSGFAGGHAQLQTTCCMHNLCSAAIQLKKTTSCALVPPSTRTPRT